LRRGQRSLSRKAKGSSNRDRARILVAKTHEKVANQRKHFLHRVANHYVKHFKTIYVEDLNIEAMVQNRYLAKSISDCSWGMFFNICSCKVEETDKRVIKVPTKNTTQVCSSCGFKVHRSLAQRIHHCPKCNLKIHRDFNSALNILAVGQTVQAQTSAMAGVA
jgi:putative transposase